jgi:chromosome segregation ATPase
MARPKLRVVRTPEREKLHERLEALRAAEASFWEAELAVENARGALAELDAEFSRFKRRRPRSEDDMVADLAAGRIDAKGEARASADYKAAEADLEARHRSLTSALGLAEQAVTSRAANIDSARRAVDMAARDVVEAEAPIAAIEAKVADLRAQLAAELRRAEALKRLCAFRSDARSRLEIAILRPVEIGAVEQSEEAMAMRAWFARLQVDADAQL